MPTFYVALTASSWDPNADLHLMLGVLTRGQVNDTLIFGEENDLIPNIDKTKEK